MAYLDQFRANNPAFNDYSDEEVAGFVYQEKFAGAGYSRAEFDEFFYGSKQGVKDVGVSMVEGANQLAGGLLMAPKLAGDYISKKSDGTVLEKVGDAISATPLGKVGDAIQAGKGLLGAMGMQYFKDGKAYADANHSDEFKRIEAQRPQSNADLGGLFTNIGDKEAWLQSVSDNAQAVKDGASFYAKNPFHLTTDIAQSVPAMATGMGGAAMVGGKVLGSAVALGVEGITEGGSAANSVAEKINRMSYEDLSLNSKAFNDYLMQGYNAENAKGLVMRDAMAEAGVLTAGASIAAGKLMGTGKFESDVATGKMGGVRDLMLEGVKREGGQEGLQTMSGEAAQNYAVQQNADDTQKIGEGLALAGTQGAIAGAGMGAGIGLGRGTINHMTGNVGEKIPKDIGKGWLKQPDARPDIGGNEGVDLVGGQSVGNNPIQETQDAKVFDKQEEAKIDQALAQATQQADMNKQAMQDQLLQQFMPQDPELRAMAERGVPVVEITPEPQQLTPMQAEQPMIEQGQLVQPMIQPQAQANPAQAVSSEVELAAPIKPEIKIFNGTTPFKTVKSAQLGRTYKTTPNARIVPVEGGYGVVDGKAWDEYEAAVLPKPEDTAYGRVEAERIQANDAVRMAQQPTVPEVDIEAAYRQREQQLERQKQLDYADAQIQAAQTEYDNIAKLQSETPIENTALRKQLAEQLMNAEIKRLMEIENRQQIMESGNPRLVEAGIEEMQGVETPDLPMPITEGLATAPIVLPENFTDERLADTAYRVVLGDVMDQSMKGGGVQLIAQQGTGYTGGDGNEYGQQVTRTKSMNHPITQALVADGYKAEEVRNALDAALKGQKLGKRWQGLVAKALDYSNTDAADIKAQMGEFEQAKAADITPENLGYGDAVNAPFAPDNAQPVTMREQAMPRGAEGGIKYSFAGQKAKTANLENRATAEQMLADGVDADTVWKQTGWEKGTDGQWKWEIDDGGAELARNYVSIVRNKGYAPLNKVLKHDSLFAAYPALKEVKVSLVARGNKFGSYSKERNVIDINLGLSKQEYLSTLMHEIQHAIQQEENFARGGSSSVITPEQREAALIELEHEAANMGLPSYESKVKDFLTGKITQEDYEDYLWDIASATKEHGMAGYKFELYQRLAGETEARNTQARLTLGAEARRNTPPRMTEDVARDKQIVRFEGGRAEFAPSTPKSEVNTLKQELSKSKDAQRLMNGGKVEVVQSESELPSDIESAITKSDANGVVQGLFYPASNKTYLIADNLSTADAMGVLTHEVGVHAWFNAANSEKKAALEKRAVGLLKTRGLASGGLRTFLDSVQQRMIKAKQVNKDGTYKDNEEAVAYIVEEAINQFADSRYLLNDNKLLDAIGAASKSLANFIADVITYLKSSMHKLGWLDTQKLTAGDLVAIAKGNMREVARNDVGVNDGMATGDMARSLASFVSDKPTAQEIADAQRELDKQLAIADKLEAEYGYLPAPNGEKSNLNRNQWAQVRTPQFKEFYGDWENESRRIYSEMEGDTGSALNTRTEGTGSAGRYSGRSGNESVPSGVREGKQLKIEQVRLDNNGEPRIYYHGTKDSFNSFDTNHPNRKDKGWLGRGVYVAGSKGLASMYARQKNGSGEKRVLDLFVAVKNPMIADTEIKNNLKYASQEVIDDFTRDAVKSGYDGVAVQYPNGEVELVSFDPKLVKSATDNIGTFSNKTGNIRFSKQGNQQAPDLIAPKFGKLDKGIATKIDRFHRLKQMQDMVQEKTGDKSVAVYDAAMRYFAIAPSKLQDMQRSVERSLKAMMKDGIDRHTLANYMYAVHAPERNAYIKAKNGTENGSGMTDQQAKDIADGLLAQHPTLKKYAADWRKMLDETMQDRIRNGTVSQKQADEWKASMPNYVPLKNAVDDADAFELETGIVTQKPLFGTGQRFNLKGKEFKEALGRKSLAGDIVEHMVFDMQRGIVRGQKNVAMIEFARTVARHVDAVGADGKKLWKVLQTRPDSDMDKVIEFMVDGRKNYIQVFDEPTLAALKGLNEDGFTAWDQAINILKKTITAWNPAFTIVNTIRDGEGAVINATQELGADGAAKMMRYVGGAARAAYAYERDNKISDPAWKKYHELYRFTGGKTGFMDVRPLEKLKADIEKLAKDKPSPDDTLWENFKLYSAKTSKPIVELFKWVEDTGAMTENMYRLAAFRVAIEQGKQPHEAAKIAKNLTVNFDRKGSDVRSLERWFLFYNAAIQGTVRMKQTLTSKGALAIVGGLIASGVALALMGGNGGEDEEGNTLFDLLPEHELMRSLPFWINGERINIPMAYGFGYFTYTGMKIGQYIRYLQTNGRNGHSLEKTALGLFKGVAMHFNPIGGLQAADATLGDSDSGVLMLAPVLADPMISVMMNKSWLGTPLYPENPYNPNDKPNSEKAFDYQKESAYYDIAQFISRATGGDGVKSGKLEFAAGEIEAFVKGYTGGLGNFVGSVANLGYMAATDRLDEVTTSKIPVVSTLAKGNSTDRLYYQSYKEAVENVKEVQAQLKQYNEGKADDGLTPKSIQNSPLQDIAVIQKFSDKAYKRLRDNEKEQRELWLKAKTSDDRKKYKASFDAAKKATAEHQAGYLAQYRSLPKNDD